MATSYKLQALGFPDLLEASSGKPQATKDLTGPELWDIVGVCLVLLNPNSKKVDLEDKKF